MINRLKEIKKLRKTRKLIAEEELKRLEIDHEYENITLKIKKIESEINQLEEDLKRLNNLEIKFREKL